jgi:hypothetical protein
MSKNPDCDRCQFYPYDLHLVCAVHPQGVDGKCLDFLQESNSRSEGKEQWSPEGYYWWDGEPLPNRPVTLTSGEQLTILDFHPIFTRVCPKCGYEFDHSDLPVIHWDCPACGWVDDSVYVPSYPPNTLAIQV